MKPGRDFDIGAVN